MNLHIHKKSIGDADDVAVQSIIEAISTSHPAKTRRDQEVFAKLFPALHEALGKRGVTRKAILLVLASKGLKMSAAKFKALYEDEAKRQSEQLERGAGS